MHVLHEKNIFKRDFPFRLFIADNIEFPPHWHEELEIAYVIEGSLQVGLDNEVYTLNQGDILIIGTGVVHYYLSQHGWRQLFIIQAGLSLFENLAQNVRDRRFINPLLQNCRKKEDFCPEAYKNLKEYIRVLIDEYSAKREGYRLVQKARLYDILALIIRELPMEKYSDAEKNKRLAKLERLDNVFNFVEENYHRDITLEDASRAVNFSAYHFTRFFKDAAGMTFGQYLSRFRVSKAEWYLTNTQDSITQIAFKAGFNSIKTFNRIFKELKGCPPSNYRKSNF